MTNVEKLFKSAREVTDVVLDPTDPMRSARVLMASRFTTNCLSTLHRHRGEFWKWTGNHFRAVNEETIRAEVWTCLENAKRIGKKGLPEPFKPNRSLVGDIQDALGAACHLDGAINTPVWITPAKSSPPARELLACGNGLLHLPKGKLYAPTPNFFNLTATEVEFNPKARLMTTWTTFLKQLFGEDQELINLLQEWFGYVLSANTRQHKILLIWGPTRSGKGTIARALTGIVGIDSVAGPTAASLSGDFGLEDLYTKPLAIISDMRIGSRTNKTMLTERLLSISGEDTLTVSRKNKLSVQLRLPTRLMILTNELPSLNDGSGALAGRYVILRLTKDFYGREDLQLDDKISGEYPAILNWAIEGYRRLMKRGHFVQPKSSLAVVEEIATLGSPVKAFINDECEVGPGFAVGVDELFVKYQDWARSEGTKDIYIKTKSWFVRDLNTALPTLEQHRPRDRNGKQISTYTGIKWVGKRM